MYYIYRIINKINCKEYIGKHKINRTKHDDYFGSGIALNNSIDKYGLENFIKIIVHDNISESLINEYEKYYISYYNTKSPIGYNLTDGGDGGNTYKYMSSDKYDITMKQLSERQTKRYSNPIERELQSKRQLNKPKSIEHRRRESESKMGLRWMYKFENDILLTKQVHNIDEFISNGWLIGRYKNFKNQKTKN